MDQHFGYDHACHDHEQIKNCYFRFKHCRFTYYLVAVPKCIRSENSEALLRQGAGSESAAGVLESTLRTISGSATQPGKMHPDLQQKAILGRQLPKLSDSFAKGNREFRIQESVEIRKL
jgi:hypothetical protein